MSPPATAPPLQGRRHRCSGARGKEDSSLLSAESGTETSHTLLECPPHFGLGLEGMPADSVAWPGCREAPTLWLSAVPERTQCTEDTECLAGGTQNTCVVCGLSPDPALCAQTRSFTAAGRLRSTGHSRVVGTLASRWEGREDRVRGCCE